MPSPFPGMDPYLEDPFLWPGFHSLIVAEIMVGLNRLILPDYRADIEERVYISDEDDTARKFIIPDVRIVPTGRRTGNVRVQSATAATALVCEPIDITSLLEDEIHEPYVRIIERRSKRVVTIIEVLSPTNKVHHSRGREQYLEKRTDARRSDTHWVEIDLLREGEPVVAREQFPACEYTVHVSKNASQTRSRLWPIRLEQQLPPIPIPLKSTDPDVILDLQEAFTTTYERGSYSFKLDYREDPIPKLPSALARWSNKLLKLKKLR